MAVQTIDEIRQRLRYDGQLSIATGTSKTDKQWKNQNMHWSVFLKHLQEPTRTRETFREYMALPRADQDRIKDVGGFVGGYVKDGKRKKENVLKRSILTLDADFASEEFITDLDLQYDFAWAVYSTHKHQPKKPRLRLIIPLTREVTPEEYEAVARKIAEPLDMNVFDDTTYQASRLMFWPSCPSDGEYVFEYNDSHWLDPDAVLSQYRDWTDITLWPVSEREVLSRKKQANRQGDPTEKKGLIGSFCRTYGIHDVISMYLSDVYSECTNYTDRYTYTEGSTSGGLVLYDDKWAYSNHGTDPASGKLCNAFDLVRIHKFGSLDADCAVDEDTTKLPSYHAMMELAGEDRGVRMTLHEERRQASEEFQALFHADDEEKPEEVQEATEEEIDDSWVAELDMTKAGAVVNSLENILLILSRDHSLKGIAYDELQSCICSRGGTPWNRKPHAWTDADDAQLESYLATTYAEFGHQKIMTALTTVTDNRKFHPVRDYLAGLPEWDGVSRVETLLSDYLGADDTPYVRSVTRKTIMAAVRRALRPGCKFDTVLVMCGPQGIGKSTLWARLGRDWFSDNLNLSDIKDKKAAEKLQGRWINELGELAGMGNAGVKSLRAFITTQDDRYRPSYGRHVTSHPRQGIMVGTTNSIDGYLNDTEGGRRFWPVNTPGGGVFDLWADLDEATVDQIWAEGKELEATGELLILTGEEEMEAKRMQRAAMISDPREGMVQEYLDKLITPDWYSLTIEQRKDFLHPDFVQTQEGTVQRTFISAQEIWVECFHRRLQDMKPEDTYAIKKILIKLPEWSARQDEKRERIGAEYGRQRVYRREQD